MKFSRMLTVCAWCKGVPKLLGISKPLPPGRCELSHGMCQGCLETHTASRSNNAGVVPKQKSQIKQKALDKRLKISYDRFA